MSNDQAQGLQIGDLRPRLGKAIKTKRHELGLTQSDLASITGLSQSQVSDLETGKSSLSLDAFVALSRALNIPAPSMLSELETTNFAVPSILAFSRLNDSYDSRLGQWALAKHCLAEYVAYLFRRHYQDQLVGIDGGTMNQFLADSIRRDTSKGQRTVGMIVTNHISVPERVSTGQNAPNVFVTGGIFRPDRKTLVGPAVLTALEEFDLVASVVGVNGFRFPSLFTKAGLENDLKNAFMSASSDIVIPIDPPKWDQVSGSKLGSVIDLVDGERKRLILLGVYPISSVTDNDINDESQVEKLTNAFFANISEILVKFSSRVEIAYARVCVANPAAAPEVIVSRIDPTIDAVRAIQPHIDRSGKKCGVLAFTITPPK